MSEPDKPAVDEPPPFWGRWNRIYWFVALLLLAQTIAFFALTRWTS
jgi:hypothetical protein